MADFDFDIEYLEEDEDVVQKCILPPPVQSTEINSFYPDPALNPIQDIFADEDLNGTGDLLSATPLLVERVPKSKSKNAPKRKIKLEEDDSDYDPSLDIQQRSHRKKTKYIKQEIKSVAPVKIINDIPNKFNLINVRIPDYDDPLCLPVRMARRNNNDIIASRNWNTLCLNEISQSGEIRKLKLGKIQSSVKTTVFSKVRNKLTGSFETAISNKTLIKSEYDQEKINAFQSVLPKYYESNSLQYNMENVKCLKSFHNKDEVILAKEQDDTGDVLVVFKPKEFTSRVFSFEQASDTIPSTSVNEGSSRRSLQQRVSCRMCAVCFQRSYRATPATSRSRHDKYRCVICLRTYVSTYNLLAHLKTHEAFEIRPFKKRIAKDLANIMEYHYKCRICQMKFESTRELRHHVITHKGDSSFYCEVGNHMVSAA